jgi:hypothetical protein
MVRIRSIVIACLQTQGAAVQQPIQIPLVVVRGPSSMGGSTGVIYLPNFNGPGYGLPTQDNPYDIRLSTILVPRNGAIRLTFTENELTAADGQRLGVILGAPFDAAIPPVGGVTATMTLAVLGEEVAGSMSQFSIGVGGASGEAKSIPRYDVRS